MRTWRLRFILRDLRDPLYFNSFFLILNSIIPPLFGFAFWLIVARVFPGADVGQAVGIIPMANLIAWSATLGLTIGLVRYLPEAGDGAKPMIRSALSVTLLATLALTALFIGGLPLWGEGLLFLHSPMGKVAFLLFTLAMALLFIIDTIFVAYRKAILSVVRNVVFGVVRIPMPILFASIGVVTAAGIFYSYALAMLLTLVVAVAILLPHLMPGFRPLPGLNLGGVRQAIRFSLGNHIAVMSNLVPGALLPIMILNTRPPVEAAYFYMTWIGANLLFIIPNATTRSLLAEGSHAVVDYRQGGRRILLFSLALLTPAVAVAYFLGDVFLSFFNSEDADYVAGGLGLLRLLALSSFFVLLLGLYVTAKRLEKKVLPVVLAGAVPDAITLSLSFPLMLVWGLEGIGWAWIVANGLTLMAIFLFDPRPITTDLLRPARAGTERTERALRPPAS
jgi:O-antigen/teichoic acid export membrane protein